MANFGFKGLFEAPGNSAGQITRLMELEREKRIRDAGAGFTNPLVRARAMAGQGMQEAISGIGTGLTGLLGGEGKIRMDPRMQEAMKRDKDRVEILNLLQGFNDPSSDGGESISDAELRKGHAALLKRGYLKEAKEFLEMAQAERLLDIKGKQAQAAADAARPKPKDMTASDYSNLTKAVNSALGQDYKLITDSQGNVKSIKVGNKTLTSKDLPEINDIWSSVISVFADTLARGESKGKAFKEASDLTKRLAANFLSTPRKTPSPSPKETEQPNKKKKEPMKPINSFFPPAGR